MADVYAIDVEFSQAVWSASRVFGGMGKKLMQEAALGDLSPLIEYLQSDRPLGVGERNELASLLRGEYARPRGRPSKRHHERERRRRIYSRYHEVMAELKARLVPLPRQEKAISIVAKEFPKTTSDQVRAIIRDKKMRV